MNRPPVLRLRDVCVSYDGAHAIEGIDLDVPEGDFVGVLGPNGSGKTTLVRAALGLAPTSCGTIELFGTRLDRFTDWDRVGYVAQHVVHVDPRFPATAYEVALLGRVGRRIRRMDRADHEAVREAMQEVGVAHLADRRIGTLSGGQRQRVFLAKEIAADPELLILDEPTTGVDPDARQDFYRLLDHLNHSHNMTIVLVSHDIQALTMSVHRLVAVNRRIVFDGDPATFEAEGGFGAVMQLPHHIHAGAP